jgi:hypothetical protein
MQLGFFHNKSRAYQKDKTSVSSGENIGEEEFENCINIHIIL